jgi:hypothetical protein
MVAASMKNIMHLFLLVMVLTGCGQEAKPTIEVTPAYVNLITTAATDTTKQVGEVKAVLQENTRLLIQIKDLVQNPPTDGVEAQETPSSPTLLTPSVNKLYVSSIPGCGPCVQLKLDDEAGKFAEAGFEVVYADDPTWDGGYPIIRWLDSEGQWKAMMYKDRRGKYRSSGYGPNTISELVGLVK